jgi:hypothetical protein
VENSVTLQVATQKGVDLNFTSVDLTLSLDDFSKRIIDPACGGSRREHGSRRVSMYKAFDVVDWNGGSAARSPRFWRPQELLNDSLAPLDERTALMNTQDMVDVVDGRQGSVQPAERNRQPVSEGFVGRAAGFDFSENTLLPSHLAAMRRPTSATPRPASPTVRPRSRSRAVRARSRRATCSRLPALTGFTRRPRSIRAFSCSSSPRRTARPRWRSLRPRTPRLGGQNIVINSAGASKAVVVAGTASTAVQTSLLYHKDAFAFATADLVMPQGVDMAAREQQDGLSIRLVRAYDINNDKFPCRLDVLYGYKAIRPSQACRLHNN